VKAFLSYSWSSPAHEAWVLNLATRLREDGVDAKLDKWDLKTGDDSFAYMETMVTDPTISKVVIICDKKYVDKSNSRSGGVGAETQILTPELYGRTQQDKFAAIITEVAEDGSILVPAFYKGRIHIDFSRSERFEDAYEELLRWLIDKPLHVRPALGQIPEHIVTRLPSASATTSSFKRAETALQSLSNGRKGALRDFKDAIISELVRLKPSEQGEDHIDDRVLQAVDLMRPYVRQIHDLTYVYCRYNNAEDDIEYFIEILEAIAQLTEPDDSISQWMPAVYETYHMVGYEILIGLIAILLSETNFSAAAKVLTYPYVVPNRGGGPGPSSRSFAFFNRHCQVWDSKKQRLGISRISLRADGMKENYISRPTFEQIMQADLVLYLSEALSDSSDRHGRSYPDTLVFASRRFQPFDLFARSESQSYFNRWFPNIISKMDIQAVREKVNSIQDDRASKMFDYHGLPLNRLTNLDHLCTKP